MKLVTPDQMRALEQAAVDAGATWPGLMEQAGWGVAQEAMRLLGVAQGKRVVVLVGPGNNGGDGLVAARHLHDAGAAVALYLWRRAHPASDPNWQRCRERDIAEQLAADDPGRSQLRRLLAQADLVIDALLGIGVSRPLQGELAEIVETLNAEREAMRDSATGLQPSAFSLRSSSFSVLAVDIPTGVDASSGAVQGAAVRADATVSTGPIKRGALLYPGRSYVNQIGCADIGLTQHQLEEIMSERLTADDVRQLLPARRDDSHKGTYGKLMVVAGSLLYPGAASLASSGGLRVGAGLVTLATGRSALVGPGRAPEVTLRPLPEDSWGTLGGEAATELLKHLEGYSALVVGPGLGQEEPTRLFVERLLGLDTPRQRGQIGFRIGAGADKPAATQRPELPPTVIDADGLNLLSQIESWWDHLPPGRCVLTPHPGEMKRLLKADEISGDPVTAAVDAAKQWRQIVVLKGATTVVAHPEGRSAVHDGGNAALATAGTGDVLAGAIGGLLAQGLAPFDAALAGVYLHSAAGRLLRDEMGDAGTIASDLLVRLPLAIKALK